MKVEDWLEQLGLGHYAAAFAEHHVDLALVHHLNDADLRELGIAALGHRKRLLVAAAELAARAPEPALRNSAQPEGERRQVTILFADLSGFTALSQSLDPEQVRDLVASFTAVVDGIVAGFDGTVDKH